MAVPSWQSINRMLAGWVQQLGIIQVPGWQIRVVRLHDVVAESGFASTVHAHAWCELSVVQRGVIAYAHGGSEHEVTAGGTLVMPPGRRHSWRAVSGPAVITGYQLLLTAADTSTRGQLAQWDERLIAAGAWTLPPHPLPTALVAALHDDATRNADLGCQLIRAHVLWSLERFGMWAADDQSGSDSSEQSEIVVRLRDYVLEHLAEHLSLAAVAKRFGVSPRHLNRGFTALTGLPIHRYIIDQRLERAAHSLVWRADPVAVIARSVGYDDAGYFGRLFRARFGESPDRWRIAARRTRKA